MKKTVMSILLSTAILVTTTFAFTQDPGSREDPLVTKSYVDQQIAKWQTTSGDYSLLKAEMEAQQQLITALVTQVQQLEKNNIPSGYELVNVPKGQHFIGQQSTEFILRGGKGLVISAAGGGLQDVTDGVDLSGGQDVPRNHLLIVPREDGRGLIAETDVIIMVKGGYTVY